MMFKSIIFFLLGPIKGIKIIANKAATLNIVYNVIMANN